jgi:hypothetical protein
MKTKSTMLTSVGILMVQACISQCLGPETIASGGGGSGGTAGSVSWTVGEPVGETMVPYGNYLTQGFQQPGMIWLTPVGENSLPGVTAYPNPFTSAVCIENPGGTSLYIELLDISGKILLEKQISDKENILNLDMLAKGMYFLNIYREKGRISSMKLNKIN